MLIFNKSVAKSNVFYGINVKCLTAMRNKKTLSDERVFKNLLTKL